MELQTKEEDTENIFTNYFSYTKDTEPPIHFHRWCWISCLGASLGRRAWINHGHFRIFPNLYVMLIGNAGSRKSTAIKMAKKVLSASGYETFSADKTSKEKFLLDLEGKDTGENDASSQEDNFDKIGASLQRKAKNKMDAVTAENLWGSSAGEPKETFIVADEFNEFGGPGNMDFFTTLGNLWDYDDPEREFTQRLKTSRSVSIFQPTISILSGNTPTLFARCFPPEAMGSGFLARLLLIYGERSNRKNTFPSQPDEEIKLSLVRYLERLREFAPGYLDISEGAMLLLDRIYQEDDGWISDIRFDKFNERRFTQLLKLTLILACGRFSSRIEEEDVIHANTILAHAGINMPKALGEFGKGKNSDVATKIMDIIEKSTKPVSFKELLTEVRNDLNNQRDLVELINVLVQSDKLQAVGGTRPGFLPKKKIKSTPRYIDWSFLAEEEKEGLE